MNTTVVNLRNQDYDVYIGRGRCPKCGEFSKWKNPFKIGEDGTRSEVIAMYEIYLVESGLINDIDELRGKILGCWCKPKPCHGDVLAKLANRRSTLSNDESTKVDK